jgi:hypothetical protein
MKPCLYCESTSNPKTDEHVVQQGFGCTTVLQNEVCGACNTGIFSPLDGELIRFVHSLVCFGHPDVPARAPFIAGLHAVVRDEENGVWVSVRLDKDMHPTVFDQLVFLGEGRWHISLDPRTPGKNEERLAGLRAELAQVPADSIKSTIIHGTDPPVEPAIIRSAPGRYLIRAATDAAAERIRQHILSGRLTAKGWSQNEGPVKSKIVEPTVHVRASFGDGDIARALVKMAVNCTCYVFGSDVARADGFAAARCFARHGDDTGGCNIVSMDVRSERMKKAASYMCPRNHHAIRFEPTQDGLIAFLILYQQPIAAVGVSPTLGHGEGWALALFNYRKKGDPVVYRRPSDAPLPGDPEWQQLENSR